MYLSVYVANSYCSYIVSYTELCKLCIILYSTLEGLYPPFINAPANGRSKKLPIGKLSGKDFDTRV